MAREYLCRVCRVESRWGRQGLLRAASRVRDDLRLAPRHTTSSVHDGAQLLRHATREIARAAGETSPTLLTLATVTILRRTVLIGARAAARRLWRAR